MTTARAGSGRLFLAAIAWLGYASIVAAAEPDKTSPAKLQAPSASQSSAAAPTIPRGTALRDEIRALLRDAARRTGQPEEAVVRRAVTLYRAVQLDTQLRQVQREPLRVALRNKLARWGEQLGPASVEPPKFLGQIGAPAQFGQAPAGTTPPVDHGPELRELIQDTIAPTTWDERGGNGVIRYWAPGHALVVRQTGDVHEQLGRLLMDMR